MRVALYLRVSQYIQKNENQRLVLEKYASANGWSNCDYYEEKESTRKTRPVKAFLLDKLRKHHYDVVCVYSISRWARNSSELITEITELTKKGIQFISVKDCIDLTTAAGKFFFQVMACVAELERDTLRERVMSGLERAKNEGIKLGRPLGSTDKKQRRKSGYFLREAKRKQKQDELKQLYQPLTHYLDETKKSSPK